MTTLTTTTTDTDKPIVETPQEPILNLKPSPPIPTSLRKEMTPLVWDLDEDATILYIEGYKISFQPLDITKVKCVPKTFEDVANFMLDIGTGYLPCNPRFVLALGNLLPERSKRELGEHNKTYINGYHITTTSGSFAVRKGNRWGRVFSYWEIFPQWTVEALDDLDPNPISLEEYWKVFWLMFEDLEKEELSIASIHTGATVAANYLLSTQARKMFGGVSDLPFHVTESAHQAYNSSRFEPTVNAEQPVDYWDLVSAYPSEARYLIPCQISHMDWYEVSEVKDALDLVMNGAYYAFAYCHIEPTETYPYSPVVLRYLSPKGMRLAGLFGPQDLWLTLPEMHLLVKNELAKVQLLTGSIGVPKGPVDQYLLGPMNKLFRLRDSKNLGRLVKGMSQKVVGKMGGMWREEHEYLSDDLSFFATEYVTKTSTIFNLVYCSHVNGAVRAKITALALSLHAKFIRADGLGLPIGTRVPEHLIGEGMGFISLKSSGPHINPDDMLMEGPKDTGLLEAINATSPDSTDFEFQQPYISSFKGELFQSRPVARAGVVRYRSTRRTFGSSKRIPITSRSKSRLLTRDGIQHRPARGIEELQLVRRLGKNDGDYT